MLNTRAHKCRPGSDSGPTVEAGPGGLQALAVEDALHEKQRPKLDRYNAHLFLSAYAVGLDGPSGQLSISEVSAFISDRVLITVHNDDRFDTKPLLTCWSDNADLAKYGSATWSESLVEHDLGETRESTRPSVIANGCCPG